MRKKVFQHAGALIIAAIILTFFTMSWAMYNNTAEQLRVSVRNECEYYRYFLDKMGDDSLDKPPVRADGVDIRKHPLRV